MQDLTFEKLFDMYQSKLAWIDRRLEPDALKFYGDTAESWRHAKEIVFDWFQSLRHYVGGGVPSRDESVFYDKSLVDGVEPHRISREVEGKTIVSEFPAIGLLRYRGREYVIYDDDYGMQSFIVVDGRDLPIESFGGPYDWYYELDRIIDKINY